MALIYWHFFCCCSNEEFKLWSSGLKRVLLDQNIERLEYLLKLHNCCPEIKCRACRGSLYYFPVEDSVDEIRWMCLNCPGPHEILRCQSEEVVNAVIRICQVVSPQLVALTLNIILNNVNRFNCLSQPSIPDNPIEVMQAMFDRSKADAFKLGGTNVVIVADIFKSIQSPKLLPILYMADTVNIPTRYYLNPLQSQIARDDSSADTAADDAKVLDLVHELIAIANRVMKPNSYLLLGPTLQSLIPARYYNDKIYKFNLRAIVPLTELKMFESTAMPSSSSSAPATSPYNIDDGLERIVNPALAICSITNTLLLRKIGKYDTVEKLYAATQKYLNSAIWLRLFVGTPFESLLYNIINDEETAVQ